MLQTSVFPATQYVTALYIVAIEAAFAAPREPVERIKTGEPAHIRERPVKLLVAYALEKDKPLPTSVLPK